MIGHETLVGCGIIVSWIERQQFVQQGRSGPPTQIIEDLEDLLGGSKVQVPGGLIGEQ